jgi:hypothetical protein
MAMNRADVRNRPSKRNLSANHRNHFDALSQGV